MYNQLGFSFPLSKDFPVFSQWYILVCVFFIHNPGQSNEFSSLDAHVIQFSDFFLYYFLQFFTSIVSISFSCKSYYSDVWVLQMILYFSFHYPFLFDFSAWFLQLHIPDPLLMHLFHLSCFTFPRILSYSLPPLFCSTVFVLLYYFIILLFYYIMITSLVSMTLVIIVFMKLFFCSLHCLYFLWDLGFFNVILLLWWFVSLGFHLSCFKLSQIPGDP